MAGGRTDGLPLRAVLSVADAHPAAPDRSCGDAVGGDLAGSDDLDDPGRTDEEQQSPYRPSLRTGAACPGGATQADRSKDRGHLCYVFTNTGRTPISDFSGAKERLEKLIEMEGDQNSPGKEVCTLSAPGWRLHDLRRTGVTVMARLGVGPHVADRVLNHVQGTIKGVAAVYQRHEFLRERAHALNIWAEHIYKVQLHS